VAHSFRVLGGKGGGEGLDPESPMANSSGIQQDGDFAATWKSVAKREKSNHRLSCLQSASTLRIKKSRQDWRPPE